MRSYHCSYKKTNFWVALSQLTTLNIENDNFINSCENIIGDRFVSRSFDCVLEAGQTLTINKYTSVLTSLKYDKEKLIDLVNKNAVQAKKNTYKKLKQITQKLGNKYGTMRIFKLKETLTHNKRFDLISFNYSKLIMVNIPI